MRKAFISPSKYVQGKEELGNLGYFVKNFSSSALLIASKITVRREADGGCPGRLSIRHEHAQYALPGQPGYGCSRHYSRRPNRKEL